MKNGAGAGAQADAGGVDRAASFRQHLTRRWAPTAEPVLIVGDSMLDLYVFGTVDRISPEAPVPVMRQQETREAAGGAAQAQMATFGGMGEACISAIEGLNVLYEEDLMGNAQRQGDYLIERLNGLRAKYPSLLKEIRGRGLMIGIEFNDISETMPFGLKHMVALLDDKLKGSLCGFVGALLLKDYDVLVAFTEYNRNVIRLEPPLIATREDCDRFIDAFDDLLGRGITRIVTDYLRKVAVAKG